MTTVGVVQREAGDVKTGLDRLRDFERGSRNKTGRVFRLIWGWTGERRQVRQGESWTAVQLQERFSHAHGKSLSQSHYWRNSASPGWACVNIPTMLSHWLAAAHRKWGFSMNKGSSQGGGSWDCQSNMLPAADLNSVFLLLPQNPD